MMKNNLYRPGDFSIRVYKQYFNFASSHFLVFGDGSREPLHGHNYRVQVRGDADHLEGDMVFDFLDIKPIVRQVCDELDHKLLIPAENPHLELVYDEHKLELKTSAGDYFCFPRQDVLILPLANTSAELLAHFLAYQVQKRIQDKFGYQFSYLEIEVEETPGQSALYALNNRQQHKG